GDVGRSLKGLRDGSTAPAPGHVYSGASGVEPATSEELEYLAGASTWIYGDAIGHGVEAHFPAGVALAAISLDGRRGKSVDAQSILVTGTGHWRGEGLA